MGANVRYALGRWAADRWGESFPYGTLIINVSGSLLLGLFLAATATRLGISSWLRVLVVTGFLGGYTTFSTYTWEALTLGDSRAWAQFALYLAGSNVLGLLGVWLGSRLGQMLACAPGAQGGP